MVDHTNQNYLTTANEDKRKSVQSSKTNLHDPRKTPDIFKHNFDILNVSEASAAWRNRNISTPIDEIDCSNSDLNILNGTKKTKSKLYNTNFRFNVHKLFLSLLFLNKYFLKQIQIF